MWILYQIALALLLLLAAPVLLLSRLGHYWPTLRGRLGGHDGRVVRGALWFHAVSVGEVMVAATVIRALPEDLPVLVTTVTPTGQERARDLVGDRAAVAYLPFDLGFTVERFLGRFEPRALVLVEGDYWPLLLHRVADRELPVAVINGRLGDRNAARLARLARSRLTRPLARLLFRPVHRFGVQSERDARRLEAVGVAAEIVEVTGNLKFESPEPRRKPELEERLQSLAGDRPILLAGSTMDGEEEAVLDAFATLGDGRAALLMIAPRHPERWDDVARTIERRGFRLVRRSRLAADRASADAAPNAAPDVVLLDSLGELAGLYALAHGTFIGGTLVPTGGHNPLEPARYGKPVAVGPSMENFRDMAADFDRAEAWARVADAGELAAVWRRWLDDPETARRLGQRAARLIDANRGALERTLELLRPLVARVEER